MSTHAVILESYITDENGSVNGISVWEQHALRGPRLKQYYVGGGDRGRGDIFTTQDARAYHVILKEDAGRLVPIGDHRNPLNRRDLEAKKYKLDATNSRDAAAGLRRYLIEAIIDQGSRAFRNTGTIRLAHPANHECIGVYDFVTGGRGAGAAPLGYYDIDPTMMAGGELGVRWRIEQKSAGYDRAHDPGIDGHTKPATRVALRIHKALDDATRGCIGILGDAETYADFRTKMMMIFDLNEDRVTLALLLRGPQTEEEAPEACWSESVISADGDRSAGDL